MKETPAASHPAVPLHPSAEPTESPRVQIVRSPGGTVLLIGSTLSGDWIAEYRCLEEDFRPHCVRAMEKNVIRKERERGLHGGTRVIEFPHRDG